MKPVNTSKPPVTVPTVTFVVPSFNEEPHIVEASLASVRAQTFEAFECIVVDESTVPERAAACKAECDKDPRFTYVHPKERLGLAGSLNLAMTMARGEFIARFDSDDLCVPDRLALQMAYMRAHPQVDVLGGALELMDEDARTTGLRAYPLEPAAVARGMHLVTTVAHPTVLFKRQLPNTLGGYSADFRFSEDLDLWLRWLKGGVQFANLPQVLVRYRQKSTARNPKHWRFNLRARLRNFGSDHLFRRLFGICAVSVWLVLPQRVQVVGFKALLLRGPNPKGTA